MALALVYSPVPGATPKEAGLGVDRVGQPSRKRIQAMSVADGLDRQPEIVGSNVASWSCTAGRRGSGGHDYLASPCSEIGWR